MKRNTLSKLAIAIAAAGFLSASAVPASAYDMTPGAMMQQLGAYVEANDLRSAMLMIARLKALGITQIEVDGRIITVAQLERAVMGATTPEGRAAIIQLVAAALAAETTAFRAGTRVVASVDSADVTARDVFPTGSAG